MEILADVNSKYLTKEAKKAKVGLRERCCKLRLEAMSDVDKRVLTALYHVYTYGGTVECVSKDLAVKVQMDGFLSQPVKEPQSEAQADGLRVQVSPPAVPAL